MQTVLENEDLEQPVRDVAHQAGRIFGETADGSRGGMWILENGDNWLWLERQS
jgi:hypothetical protein